MDHMLDLQLAHTRGEHSAGTYLDLTKAFDHVRHDLLRASLCVVGWPFALVNPIMSMCSGRKIIKVGGIARDLDTACRGVPQGCPFAVMGMQAVLATLHMDTRIPASIRLRIYVDDVCVWLHGTKPQWVSERLVEGYHAIQDWFETRGLALNSSKTIAWTTHATIANHLKDQLQPGIEISKSARDLGIDVRLRGSELHVTSNLRRKHGMRILRRIDRLGLPREPTSVLIQSMVIGKTTWSWAIDGVPPNFGPVRQEVQRVLGYSETQGRSSELYLTVFAARPHLDPVCATHSRALELWRSFLRTADPQRRQAIEGLWWARHTWQGTAGRQMLRSCFTSVMEAAVTVGWTLRSPSVFSCDGHERSIVDMSRGEFLHLQVVRDGLRQQSFKIQKNSRGRW
eukprot:568280-Amphidinium_carterae.1